MTFSGLFGNLDILVYPDVLDRVLEWKLTWHDRGAGNMQRQFTMEMRVDFADADKNEAFQEAIQHIGRHALATMQLLSDGQKPQIAIWSDDFYAGRKEIMLFDDLLNKSGSESANSPDAAQEQDSGPSDEMLRAMRGD